MIGPIPGIFPAVSAQPEVMVGGVSVVAAAAIIDYTNAVRVTAAATDRAEVRVGYGLNANVTLGTETTAVGAGHSVTVRAGDAVGAGPSAGGDITIQPGAGIGGGARGKVLPNADNAVSLGSLTLAWFEIFVNTVGSLNQDLNLVATRTTAGAGRHIIISGGPAIGGGPSAGGDVRLTPGNGVGGGARGVILLDDAGSALSVLPFTTNLVTVGSASLAFAAVRTRIVQADTGQSLTIVRGDGTTMITFPNAATPTVSSGLSFLDAAFCSFGSSDDAQIRWSTSSANNLLMINTNVNSAAQSGNVILTAYANRFQEHGLAAVATPRLAIFSAADMSVAGNRTQNVQLWHDGTDGNLWNNKGTGVLRLRVGTNAITPIQLSPVTAGGITMEFTQPANTSGSPTGLLFVYGVHTGLTHASLTETEWRLNRNVTFTAGTNTIGFYRGHQFGIPTLISGAGTLTINDAATVYIGGAPAIGANVAADRAHALLVAGGQVTCAGSLMVGTNAVVTGGFVADIDGALRITAAPRFDYALAAADTNVPVFINTPTGVDATQKGWRRIDGASGDEEYVPVWGVP